MARLAGTALAVSALLLPGLAARPAGACSLAPTYLLPSTLLASADFNEPGSDFDRHYRESAANSGGAPPVIRGVYRIEVVASVDPAVVRPGIGPLNPREISRGSVAVVTHYWGEAPEDLGPFAAGRPTQWERIPDTGGCEFLSYPVDRSVGETDYLVLTSGDDLTLGTDEDADAHLSTGFGPPVVPDRDAAAEAALLAELQAEHDAAWDDGRTWLTVAIVFGLAAIAAVVSLIGFAVVRRNRV